ncbi:pyruvate dehydrogenase complex dihydrolipoamide acetyltransferase [Dongia rigui]|uniref:Acetyltransferase component of pyruvate dehydrogenase complex n=1 Tax=Dongia rigui TaxID=940149 RepID=A0ABU5E4M6_9PROT|nr:pyruvate dehydrogenase complex dihydrolipoamide acetyltransferase [Dongia rigui]MDY0874392.1 pyruvate dehydrogenase complex dihydrolipoamide acetyltransferase [Dongia rigui]
MPINILMPALSPTMTEGNLAKWLKKEGDAVKAGDVLAEIETDKATMEVEAVDEGTLAKILVPGGAQGVKVNDVIAVLIEEGEDASAVGAAPATKAAPAPSVTPSAAPAKADAAPAAKPAAAPATGGGRVIASPLAKRIAEQQGIDLSAIKGSGPNGRIVKADVEGAPKGGAKPAPAAAAKAPSAAPVISSAAQFGEPEFDLIPHTSMRKTIARRLQESKQFVPHFYLSVDCEIDKLLKLREEVNAASPKDGPGAYKVSVNDFVIKASAVALMQVPTANASWSDDGVKMYKSADISVAVAIPGGLITPILRHADKKRITELSMEMKELAGRAKQGKLKPEDYTGGSFSVSNLGMFGIKSFSAVINPPQACILAVGAGEERAVVKNGQLTVANVMTCTLSVDHRAVDGAIGAEFLAAFKRLIEQPLAMLV